MSVGVFAGMALAAMGQHAEAKSALGVDCSQIKALGSDKQANLRAAAIRVGCGLEPGGAPGTAPAAGEAPESEASLAPPANVDTITGTETYPHVTQSESMVWSSDGTTIVVNYNDSRTAPSNYSGLSVSTDAGTTFTRLNPSPFASGHGTNFGDPNVVFNAKLSKWFAGDLASGCGGFGIGLWTSTDGISWSTGACAHSGGNDDRNSMWVDNDPTSPFFGRMYILWNDFNVGGGALYVTHSDDGTTWKPVQVKSTFIRDVQITGGLGGDVWLAAMDEGGGGFNNRTNYSIARPTAGGRSAAQSPRGRRLRLRGTRSAAPTAISPRSTRFGDTWGGGSRGVSITSRITPMPEKARIRETPATSITSVRAITGRPGRPPSC